MSVSDAALIARTRNGDTGAYHELYLRHVDDATRVARIVVADHDDAQDLVSEAFTRVLRRLQQGEGPDEDLGPYLRTVVRRLAIDRHRSAQHSGAAEPSTFDTMPSADDPIAKATDRQLVRRAFEMLPPRWQEVLWHTEVEGHSPAWLADRLGSSPNSVAALAYRAREGLRQAYLSINVTTEERPECRPFARQIPALVRGTLPARHADPLRDHLAGCADCRERRDELFVLVSDLPAVLWPALLLPIAGPGFAAGTGAVAGAGGGLFAWLSPSSWKQHLGRVLTVSGTTVVAAAAIVAAVMLAADSPEDTPAGAPPPTVEHLPQDSTGASSPPEDVPTQDAVPTPDEDVPPSDDATADPAAEGTVEPSAEREQPSSAAEAPEFVTHPRSVTVRTGAQVTFSTEVSGRPAPELQWQVREGAVDASGESVAEPAAGGWSDLAAEDGTDLELVDISPDFNGREYRVVATNEFGSATSDVAAIDVRYPPVVVTGPNDMDAQWGEDLVLRAATDANPASSARWQIRRESGWTDVAGSSTRGPATALALEDVDFDDDSEYRAVFANELGTTATASATLSVTATGALHAVFPRLGDRDGVVRCIRPDGERLGPSDCGSSAWRLSADGELRWVDDTCLDVRGRAVFSHVGTMAQCSSAQSQRWSMDPAGTTPQALENRDGVCLAIYGWHGAGILAGHPCDSPWSRQFVFRLGDG